MKRKSNSTSSITVKFSDTESSAISSALDFLLHSEEFSYEAKKFSWEHASRAAWKVDDHVAQYTRTEIRAMSAAIDYALHSVKESPSTVAKVENLFPALIPDLKESVSTLEILSIRFHAYIAK